MPSLIPSRGPPGRLVGWSVGVEVGRVGVPPPFDRLYHARAI